MQNLGSLGLIGGDFCDELRRMTDVCCRRCDEKGMVPACW